MIVEFEVLNGISVESQNDFEFDDEVLDKEEFLSAVEEQISGNKLASFTSANKICDPEILDQLSDSYAEDSFEANISEKPTAEIFDELDDLFDPSNKDIVSQLVKESKKQASNV